MSITSDLIIVVEPHADDAYLSMHQHMVDWIKEGKRVGILTVFSGTRKRAQDAKTYADSIGASWVGLGIVEGESIGNAFIDPQDFVGMLDEPGDFHVVSPIGIQHHEHQAVRGWISMQQQQNFLDPLFGLSFYVEIPYYSKLKNQDEVNSELFGRTIVSIKKPKHYKVDEKYWKCFKDQSKFFYFNPAEGMKDIVEIIVA